MNLGDHTNSVDLSDVRRVMVKFSGGQLAGTSGRGPIDPIVARRMVDLVRSVREDGLEVVVVVGGGNFYRGRDREGDVQEMTAHHIGMLGSLMCALAFADTCCATGVDAQAVSMIQAPQVVDVYRPAAVVSALQAGRVVIVGGGTMVPGFSTDTAAVTVATHTGCDVVLKCTSVDGVYDRDPRHDAAAKMYTNISFADALAQNLEVMDQTAFAWCRERNLPLVVCNLNEEDALRRALQREIGTIVHGS